MDGTSGQHRSKAAAVGSVAVAIVTISDSRNPESDPNGKYLREQIEILGHQVLDYRVIPDDPGQLMLALDEIADSEVQLLLLNGGTGISKRDNTFDVLDQRLEKVIPGFGELFRMLSYEHVGSAAMLSRALAGTYKGLMVFSTPGSPKAVCLAWEKLIAPELQHIVWELSR
jgi:molybdenum cofactor biosynthesis protein B